MRTTVLAMGLIVSIARIAAPAPAEAPLRVVVTAGLPEAKAIPSVEALRGAVAARITAGGRRGLALAAPEGTSECFVRLLTLIESDGKLEITWTVSAKDSYAVMTSHTSSPGVDLPSRAEWFGDQVEGECKQLLATSSRLR